MDTPAATPLYEKDVVVCPAGIVEVEGSIETYVGSVLVRTIVTLFADAWPSVTLPVREAPALIVELGNVNVIAGVSAMAALAVLVGLAELVARTVTV